MADYHLTGTDIVIRTEDGAFIPADPENRNRQEYDKWLAAGGVPDPYEPPPVPEPQPDALTEAQKANARLDAGILAAQNAANTPAQKPVTEEDTSPVTHSELATLQAQVDTIQAAVTAMLQAQAALTLPS